MRRFFSAFWSILKYLLVYIVCNIFAVMGIVIYQIAKYSGTAEQPGFDLSMGRNIILVTLVASLISLAFFALMIKSRHKNISSFLRLRRPPLRNILICTIIITGFSILSSSLVNLFIDFFPHYNSVSETLKDSFNSTLGIASALIFLPIFEEILFRGIIFNELWAKSRLSTAVIIQALIFGVFHGNILQGVYTFIMGIVLVLIYLWTDSLWACMVSHIIYNTLGTLVIPSIIHYTGNLNIIYVPAGLIIFIYGFYLARKDLYAVKAGNNFATNLD